MPLVNLCRQSHEAITSSIRQYKLYEAITSSMGQLQALRGKCKAVTAWDEKIPAGEAITAFEAIQACQAIGRKSQLVRQPRSLILKTHPTRHLQAVRQLQP